MHGEGPRKLGRIRIGKIHQHLVCAGDVNMVGENVSGMKLWRSAFEANCGGWPRRKPRSN
jgi:hypothetical protein